MPPPSPPELLKAWVDINKLTFPVLGDIYYTDSVHSAYELYHSTYQPMNYTIKRDGTVYSLIEGFYETALRTAVKAITD